MKKKKMIVIALAINLVGVLLNFPDFLMGNPVKMTNLAITTAYIFSWSALLFWASQNKYIYFAQYACFYWGAAVMVALADYSLYLTNSNSSFLLPFMIVFATPLYGYIGFASPYIPNYMLIFIAVSISFSLIGAAVRRRISMSDSK